MGESDPAGSTVTAAREISSSNSPPGKAQTLARPGRFTLASYVDTIREGIKKISGYKDITNNSKAHIRREVSGQHPPLETAAAVAREGRRKVGGIVIGVKRKNGIGNHVISDGSHAKRKTSFETFLSTLPKSDPVDRTVGWVYQQPVDILQVRVEIKFSIKATTSLHVMILVVNSRVAKTVAENQLWKLATHSLLLAITLALKTQAAPTLTYFKIVIIMLIRVVNSLLLIHM